MGPGETIEAEDLGAFVSPFAVMAAGADTGPLAGLTFALKDLFDVKGYITGCGSPRWAETHEPAGEHAPVLARLLEAGATLMGKTHTDELAFSLLGINPNYGTPLNPRAPERIPGGSSSGSAAAVSAGVVDFAVGSDTGGSVRLPASFCGIYGMRPSHGRISLTGVMPLAPSFDTVGWFARDAAMLERVGSVLLQENKEADAYPSQVCIAVDAFERMNEDARAALRPVADVAAARLGAPREVRLSENGLAAWMDVFRVVQAREAWQSHRDWLEAVGTPTDRGVGARFKMGSQVSDDAFAQGCAAREAITERMNGLLDNGTVLILPTVPDIAPLKNSSPDFFAAFRDQALSILCPAGLARLPQITLPVTIHENVPLGLSLVGARGSDAFLLRLARRLAEDMKLP